MNILESIRFAFSAIWANRMRSVLTMLGIVIGVFAVITLMSIGDGVQSEFSSAVDSFGGNVAIVTAGDIDGGTMDPTSMMSLSSLTMEDNDAIQAIDSVKAASPLMIVPGSIAPPVGDPYIPLMVATNDKMAEIIDMNVLEGRAISQQDLDDKSRVILVGRDVAKVDFEGSPIGQTVTVLETEFEVIGILETEIEFLGGGSEEDDSFLSGQMPNLHEAYVIPITTAKDVLNALNIFRINVEFETTEVVEQGVEEVEALMLERHKGVKDFSVLTTDDMLDLFNQFFDILTSAVVGIAAISLLVGGIGIMNIMLVSVTERTREIGIRKALGATNSRILTQFLIESGVLSFLGGFLGVGLSYLATKLITQLYDIPTLITIEALGLAFGVSVFVGIVFGIMPASKAARKNPIEALRYE